MAGVPNFRFHDVRHTAATRFADGGADPFTIAAILGVIISPLWFWIEARNKKKDDEDIDATLARMRAGQQS